MLSWFTPPAAWVALALVSTVGPALAAPIGQTVAIENRVSGSLGGRAAPLSLGDPVQTDEVLTAQAGSSARLRLLDDTNLFVGPSSSVKLDRFVFDPGAGARQVTIGLLQGGFRFVTGTSDHRAYRIETPTAVIGVRGTTVGFVVDRTRTTVILKEGAVIVCQRTGARRCATASQAETIVQVGRRQISQPFQRRAGDPDFADWCRGGGAACGLP